MLNLYFIQHMQREKEGRKGMKVKIFIKAFLKKEKMFFTAQIMQVLKEKFLKKMRKNC